MAASAVKQQCPTCLKSGLKSTSDHCVYCGATLERSKQSSLRLFGHACWAVVQLVLEVGSYF